MKNLFLVVLACLGCTSMAYAADAAYRLHPGDGLQVSVWGEDTLNKDVRVLPDGSISFPLAGRVEVNGLTTPEVEKAVTEKLKTYLPDPQVTAVVINTDGNRAYVLGKVARSGPVGLSTPTTVLQALSIAGGLDKFADDDAIKLLRDEGGKQTVIAIDYDSLIKGQHSETNILLQAGDTIVVP